MQKQWVASMVLAGALVVCPTVEAAEVAEKISAQLLKKAERKVERIVGLITLAKSGNDVAQYELGRMIVEEGREYGEAGAHAALEWFLRAARQGHSQAQWYVSYLYHLMSFDPDSKNAENYRVRALAWDRVLVRKKGQETIDYRNGIKHKRSELLRGHLTDDQVTEAERLSHEFEREIKRRPGKEESSK